MKLTPKMLSKIEESLWTSLTREQRAIMLCWFGSEGRCPWEYEDFLIGFKNVRFFYPDHRPKDFSLPSFIVKTIPFCERHQREMKYR